MPTQPVPEVIAERGTDDADNDHQRKAEVAAPNQVASQREDGFLRHWEAHASEKDNRTNGGVAPMFDEECEHPHHDDQPVATG
jgi:hypothetical protein